MAKKNKVHYDLIDVHYAKLDIQEDGTPVFSAPKKLPGSVSLETSAEGEQIVQRADGIDYYIDTVSYTHLHLAIFLIKRVQKFTVIYVEQT